MHPTNGHGGPGSGPPEALPPDSDDPNGPTAPRPHLKGRPLPGREPRTPKDRPDSGPDQDAREPRLKHGPRPGSERRTSYDDRPTERRRPSAGRSTPPGRSSSEPRPRPERPPYASPDAGPIGTPPGFEPGLAPYNPPVPGPYGPPRGHGPQPGHPPFSPPPPPPSNTAASLLWSLAPLLTCGAATPFTMGYAAAKLRSTMLGISAALYAIGMAAFLLAVVADGPGRASTILELLGVLGSTGSWLGGTIHSLIIRKRVFDRTDSPNDYAVAAAQHRRQLRQQARELAERDPALARELRIGRPDLPRHYDDGGLVDVNHAPVEVIAGLPGMTTDLARRVVEARADVGGFVSAEDVSIAVDLPPRLTPDLVELTIYLP
ncbi:hypothetical protein DQ384_08215 [Sphaerisporangium album]|uniref:Helix-hairpin-helix domain-containing protein n=1 Tax=Sphaerisporangium album TaxID=509200 RepID=A0A367FMS1_9ACTN|nr:helix-hairpin-helix domain-containing protein [Sphaerisporangium album]RCG31554.1 hypothetical protein DQ384_08215 [Sphaerisporangium album]